MAQHLLHDAKVGSMIKEVGCTQWRNTCGERWSVMPALSPALLITNQMPCRECGCRLCSKILPLRHLVAATGEELRRPLGRTSLQEPTGVGAEPDKCSFSLCKQPYKLTIEVDCRGGQSDYLADASPGGVHQLENCTVAARKWITCRTRLDEFDRLLVERLRNADGTQFHQDDSWGHLIEVFGHQNR